VYRLGVDYLEEWRTRPSRKPIVVRGARQVGKSFLVRAFARERFAHLIEVNFEKTPGVASLFDSKSPKTILAQLEVRFNTPATPGKTLLFLDEIQAAPEVMATLRYFHEEMPELHVVCAGSLLEFVLEEHSFSMPVGRIEYLHLGPMTFEEFLIASDRDQMRQWLCDYTVGTPVPEETHRELLRCLRQYLVVGGLPEAVAVFAANESYRECEQVQQSILSTYRDDFSKYASKVKHRRVEKVFAGIPRLVGRKFMYSQIDREERSRDLSEALRLLCLARVAHQVRHSHAGGLPLAAEADDRHFKALFLDVGLLCRSLGLGVADIENPEDALFVNQGALCEQFIGQHLAFSGPCYEEPALYCWMRQERNSNAEVDFVMPVGPDIVPVEVKAGKTGTLKSLHLFVREKDRDFALRFNSDTPSLCQARTGLATGPQRPFRLLSLPLYMVGQTRRLCRIALARQPS
jgi:predicted AAA+ superfamily ATPase